MQFPHANLIKACSKAKLHQICQITHYKFVINFYIWVCCIYVSCAKQNIISYKYTFNQRFVPEFRFISAH